MKLTEKQAFRVMNEIMNWVDPNEQITAEERAHFVMQELINLELGEGAK